MQRDRIFEDITRAEDFVFDEKVAAVFDDMVARSVPFYQEIQRLQAGMAVNFLPRQNGLVCDFGCSTGTTIEAIIQHPGCPETSRFIGFDNSQPMLDKAADKLQTAMEQGRVNLQRADLCALPALPECHVAVLNWTLQFVRPIDREQLLTTVYQALADGGILLLSEKILSHDSGLNRLYIDCYLHYKKSLSGYSDTENQRKREALENVLIPFRLDENIKLLERAGFTRIDCYFRWLNFLCLIAVK
ncbi:MAG: carboxy-S-adenosyl-L-methionine synthase CmoA [Methylobacter sp.]|nr:MAG: carboxy-S-adenosyl-L-methionine synthase CmoA [Methylobacter sp.]PPD05019.1 MAG: carboxy-S-adenosyl-L-methionine synthase CmoA [Methylobacter sp.]PPD21106.1 MAG: carboxy-S-adenosyl-L-methionine synthase CmoA [Methylobacter sp.]PPD32014.1 MAG: carboxy-S-adenosyl-L-methionine synthase CmoA [Methylomonas sp.]